MLALFLYFYKTRNICVCVCLEKCVTNSFVAHFGGVSPSETVLIAYLSTFIPLYGLIWRRLTNTLSLCSFLPLLRPRERDSGSEWRPGAALPSGPGADGRGQNVVPEERLGRCKICKIVTQNHGGFFFFFFLHACKKGYWKGHKVPQDMFAFCWSFNCDCICLPFISDQVLEAHGLKPISLKPKEVMFKTQQHSHVWLSRTIDPGINGNTAVCRSL